MEINFHKCKLTCIHPGEVPKKEDFHLTISENRLHEKILKFTSNLILNWFLNLILHKHL